MVHNIEIRGCGGQASAGALLKNVAIFLLPTVWGCFFLLNSWILERIVFSQQTCFSGRLHPREGTQKHKDTVMSSSSHTHTHAHA